MTALDKAIYDYHNTKKTINEICKEHNITKTKLYYNLDYREEWRKKNRRSLYNYNLETFKKDSHEKYYWLGFLSADGGIVNNTLHIDLKVIDKQHLIKFNNFCQNDNPIKVSTNSGGHEYARVEINSYELIEYLKDYNIYNKKSLNFEIPVEKIPEEYRMDYVRGLIDGDGCIRINNHQQISLSFCSGSKKCVEQVKELIGCTNSTCFSGGVWRFQVTGNRKAKAFLDKIYETSTENTRLDRKYNIYKSLN